MKSLKLISLVAVSSFVSIAYGGLINFTMSNLRDQLNSKCGKEKEVPLSKELFSSSNEFESFVKQLESLLISKPANACDFLKHPDIFKVISVLPELNYVEKKGEQKWNYLKAIEEEYSRKFFISKILQLKENILSIEKDSLDKKRAENAEEFYLKALVGCVDSKCPEKIFLTIYEKIPKTTLGEVYGKKIQELFLDENNLDAYFRVNYLFKRRVDLSYNHGNALKNSLQFVPSENLSKNISNENYFTVFRDYELNNLLKSKEELQKLTIPLDELTLKNFNKKNPIGFAASSSLSVHLAFDSGNWKEVNDAISKLIKIYDLNLVVYSKPDWNSEVLKISMNHPIKKTPIYLDIDYFNVYGVVNSEKGNWFLIKDEMNKEFWLHQSQFYETRSISTLIFDSNLDDEVFFYESPGGTKTKKNTTDLKYTGYKAKAFKWIEDQLWVLVETKSDEIYSDVEYTRKGKSETPIQDLWFKVFNENGSYNFMHATVD